jgi:transposase-like protein
MDKDIKAQLEAIEKSKENLNIQYSDLFKHIDKIDVDNSQINDMKELFSMLNSGNINESKVKEIQERYANKVNK